MTVRNTWKGYERRVASDLQGHRVPVTGLDRAGADVVTPMFHCQLKLRRALPAWLWAWMDGICRTTPEGKVGILILRTPRQRDTDALVVMRYSDFVDLHGSPQPLDGRTLCSSA